MFSKLTNKLRAFRYQHYDQLLAKGKLDNNSRIKKFRFDKKWESRINLVLSSPENKVISRVTDAGIISNGFQVMHNGIRILTGGYYGLPIAKMLYLNKGVHEPEEERIFGEILSKIPAGATMIEMGSYWAFYSMWFLKEIKKGNAFMIEAEKENLEVGMQNFEANGFSGDFNQYYVSDEWKDGIPPTISLDEFVKLKQIQHVNIAHSDIQGFESAMLEGASHVLSHKMVDYFFISTHSNQLHRDCVKRLENFGYIIQHNIDLNNISSEDGLIVAYSPNVVK